MDAFAYYDMIAARADVSGKPQVGPSGRCMLCGHTHERGTPCDFTGADSIVSGKVSIPEAKSEQVIEPASRPVLHAKRKYERKNV